MNGGVGHIARMGAMFMWVGVFENQYWRVDVLGRTVALESEGVRMARVRWYRVVTGATTS